MAGVWPTELNLFFLPRSGLKSPEEEFGQVTGAALMKNGLLLDGPARDAWDVLTDLPTLPAVTCAAFCLVWAFLQNSVKNLSAWGYSV